MIAMAPVSSEMQVLRPSRCLEQPQLSWREAERMALFSWPRGGTWRRGRGAGQLAACSILYGGLIRSGRSRACGPMRWATSPAHPQFTGGASKMSAVAWSGRRDPRVVSQSVCHMALGGKSETTRRAHNAMPHGIGAFRRPPWAWPDAGVMGQADKRARRGSPRYWRSRTRPGSRGLGFTCVATYRPTSRRAHGARCTDYTHRL